MGDRLWHLWHSTLACVVRAHRACDGTAYDRHKLGTTLCGCRCHLGLTRQATR